MQLASVRRWNLYEVRLQATGNELRALANPFEVHLVGTFVCRRWRSHRVRGFYDGDSVFVLRFSPPDVGRCSYTTQSDLQSLDGKHGSFDALPAHPGEHGPVRAVAGTRHFEHADGTPHFSVGTTSYAWAHHNRSTIAETLATLDSSAGRAFNKLRFAIHPKWFFYNHEQPRTALYPYAGTPPRRWDFRTFAPAFWRHLEVLVDALRSRGVIAELILYHPYDGVPLKETAASGHQWGFDCMGGPYAASYNTVNDEHYLRYAVARLAAFSNVWWSMANEWDLIACKGRGIRSEPPIAPIWDKLFETLRAEDPYPRELSVHNWDVPGQSRIYNHSQPWIDHISLQGNEASIRNELTRRVVAGEVFSGSPKPIIWDEVGYEGDVPFAFGKLEGREMVDRFWHGLSLGVHVGHSETILQSGVADDEQVMWWSKGGRLRGTSPQRIRWFRQHVEGQLARLRLPFSALRPLTLGETSAFGCECSAVAAPGAWMVVHVRSRLRPCEVRLPGANAAAPIRAFAIDYWAMRRHLLRRQALPSAHGVIRVDPAELPLPSDAPSYVLELTFARTRLKHGELDSR
jgi:hypothetical protein